MKTRKSCWNCESDGVRKYGAANLGESCRIAGVLWLFRYENGVNSLNFGRGNLFLCQDQLKEAAREGLKLEQWSKYLGGQGNEREAAARRGM